VGAVPIPEITGISLRKGVVESEAITLGTRSVFSAGRRKGFVGYFFGDFVMISSWAENTSAIGAPPMPSCKTP
jgi:hypothetical protein